MALKKHSQSTPLRPIEARDYPRDADGLISQLVDADASVRRWAARDLAQHPDHPEVAATVCARLAVETDLSVRTVLFSSAARLGGSTVVAALLLLLRSEHAGLRNGAIEVLAGLPGAVAPHVDRLLNDADSDVRIFTVNLLGDLHHASVLKWLEHVLTHDPAVNVVGAALEVLAEVGSPESLPALRIAARRFGDDAYIGFAVELAVERIGRP